MVNRWTSPERHGVIEVAGRSSQAFSLCRLGSRNRAGVSRRAAEVGADVIAMSTRGHGGVARLLEGSVAAGVLHAVRLPVLLFHPDTDAPNAADTDRP